MEAEARWALQRDAARFHTEMVERTAARVPRALERVGTGPEGVARGLEQLERRVRRSVWNLQRSLTLTADLLSERANRNTRRRGLARRLVVAPGACTQHPLLTSRYPDVRIGPVQGPLIIADGTVAVVPGASSASGEITVWMSTDPMIVARAVAIFEATDRLSTPALPPGRPPPFTPRQVDVALLLVSGATDLAIARELGVSARTVSSDVQHLVHGLGVSGRAAAIATLAGYAAGPA